MTRKDWIIVSTVACLAQLPAAAVAQSTVPVPVTAFFAALETRDPSALEGLLAEQIVTILPMNASGSIQPGDTRTFAGKAATLQYFAASMKAMSDGRFVNAEYTVSPDGRTVFAENQGSMRLANGQSYANLYVWRLDLDGGRIVRIREYFNPVTAAIAFGRPLGPSAKP